MVVIRRVSIISLLSECILNSKDKKIKEKPREVEELEFFLEQVIIRVAIILVVEMLRTLNEFYRDKNEITRWS